MSEFYQVFTKCDMCRVEVPTNSEFIDVWGIAKVYIPGVFQGSELAAEDDGWVQKDFGIVCPECAQKLRDEEADETNVEHGARLDVLNEVISAASAQEEETDA